MTGGEARRRLGAAMALVALVWLATAAAAPILEAGGAMAPAALARILFSFVCHQQPDRSFFIEGAPLAVCARCTGLYAGFLAGCLGLALAAGRRRAAGLPGARILLAAAIPTLIEAAAERSGLWPASSLNRALTGALLAAPLAPLAAAAVRELPAELAGEIGRLTRVIRRTHAGTC